MDTMIDAYKTAMRLLMKADGLNYEKIATELAIEYPEIFVKLAAPQGVQEWMKDTIKFMKRGDKVGAIKAIRAKTGFSLKEAKDVSDHLQDAMYNRGLVATEYGAHDSLNPECYRTLGDLIRCL